LSCTIGAPPVPFGIDGFKGLGNGLLTLESEKKIRGAVCVFGRPEDLVLIVFERLNPGAHVGGMPCSVVRGAPFRGQEYTGELRSELLFGIVRITEAIAVHECLTVQPLRMAAPVPQLMEGSAVVVGG